MIAKYVLAGVAIAFSVGVCAAENEVQMKFNKLDTNKDGKISLEEAAGQNDLLSDWSTIDANKDLELEYSEFSAFETPKAFQPPGEDSPEDDSIGAAPR